MAHFQAGVQGNRGPATRLGTAKSGIYAFARGWDGGARIDIWQRDGEDYIKITVGPHHNTSRTTLIEGPIEKVVAFAGIAWLQIAERLAEARHPSPST